MSERLILASASATRQMLLRNCGIAFEKIVSRIDEDTVKTSMSGENASPRDIADTLAEYKARKISLKHPECLVLGSDQVGEFGGTLLSKAISPEALFEQLSEMRGKHHSLHSAAVIYSDGQPVWRAVTSAKLHMHDLSDRFLKSYVDRNWDDVQHCVGGYQIEAEGLRLFSRIEGDYFTVLGLPLFEILNYLRLSGRIEG